MGKPERYLAVDKENEGLRLKAIDRLIIAQIEEFQNNGRECYITNEQFSWKFGESVSTVKRSIDRLESLNIIKRNTEPSLNNGKTTRKRFLYVNDRKKWSVQYEPTKGKNDDDNNEWSVQYEPTKNENGRFSTNLPNEMVGSNIENGRFKNEEWSVHIEPIRTNLKEKLKTNLDGNFVSSNAHPSGSLEHPSDAEPSAKATAQPSAVPETKEKKTGQKKKKDKKREPEDLSIQEKEEIAKAYRSKTMEYPDIYKHYNLRDRSLNYDKIVEFEAEIVEDKKNKEKNIIVSQLESQPDKLAKLSEYSECSIEEVKENVSKFRLNVDMLIDCFEGDSGYIYEHDYWLENSPKCPYWKWVADCYDLQYHASLGSGSVVGSSSYSIKTEDFDDVIDDADLINADDADSIENVDYNSMTDEQLSKLIDSWL